MMISKDLLDELLKGCERPEDLLGDAGLMKELRIKLTERMLGAELTAHPLPGRVLRSNAREGGVMKRVRMLPLANPTGATARPANA